MPRFQIDHLVDQHLEASCGFDPFCGFFAGVLRFLEHHGFIVCLEDALVAMSDPELAVVPSGVQRTIEIVMQFKAAAD